MFVFCACRQRLALGRSVSRTGYGGDDFLIPFPCLIPVAAVILSPDCGAQSGRTRQATMVRLGRLDGSETDGGFSIDNG